MRGPEARIRGGVAGVAPAGDARIAVVVQPRARRSALDVRPDGTVRVHVTAPPVDGAANRAVCELVARLLGCGRSAVEVIQGQAARHKVVRVRGLSDAVVGARLAAVRRGEA
jgi:uncharacterized protein (TIGR00251 family)